MSEDNRRAQARIAAMQVGGMNQRFAEDNALVRERDVLRGRISAALTRIRTKSAGSSEDAILVEILEGIR